METKCNIIVFFIRLNVLEFDNLSILLFQLIIKQIQESYNVPDYFFSFTSNDLWYTQKNDLFE